MNANFDSGVVLALVAAGAAFIAACMIIAARSMLAIALMVSLFGALLGVCALALDAPDLALVLVLAGAGLTPLFFIGAAVLTTHAIGVRKAPPRLSALVSSLAVGAGLIWTAPDLPAFGGADFSGGRIYVGRAVGEVGVRNGVAAIAGGYRAIDSLALIGAIFAAGLAAYATLGFGERAARARPLPDEDALR